MTLVAELEQEMDLYPLSSYLYGDSSLYPHDTFAVFSLFTPSIFASAVKAYLTFWFQLQNSCDKHFSSTQLLFMLYVYCISTVESKHVLMGLLGVWADAWK